MPSGFRSEALSLAELLSGPRVLLVPDYQRPYSWTITEAEQLLDDLLLAHQEAQGAVARTEGYFLGAVLLMERKPDPGTGAGNGTAPPEPHHLDIVDGQQRLATLTILLAVLRDLAGGADAVDQLIDPLLWTSPRGSPGRSPRIRLRGREGDFLRLHVQEPGASWVMPGDEPLSLGETRMLDVREHLAGALSALAPDEIAAFAGYLATSSHFAVITTHTVDRAHRIFTVLNERGRPLSRNDILKVQIIGAIAPERRDQHVGSWDRIEQQLGESFEQLFSHIRAIEGRGRTRVIDEISDLIAVHGGAERFFVEMIEPYAAIYASLLAPEAAGISQQLRQYIHYLGWLGSADWMPAAMLFWRQSQGEPARLEEFLRRLDRLAYGLRLLGLGADKRQSRFNAVVAAVREGNVLANGQGALDLTRDELRNVQYNLRNLHARSQLTCKLVLMRLNDELEGRPQALSPADLTVEHVLPQKPGRNSQWRQWFPSTDERESCTQSLGNLVLVTRVENDQARNMELQRKLAVYFPDGKADHALAITRELAGISEWRPAQIAAREERLTALIGRVWGIDTGRPAAGAAQSSPARRTRSAAAQPG